MTHQGPLFRRFWLLALFRGIEHAGYTPITPSKLHALAYLANALAPAYNLTPLDPTLLKLDDGPLYPKMFWEIERLVGMRLLAVHSRDNTTQNVINIAEYSITKQGVELVENAANVSLELQKTVLAQKSIALAYSRNPSSGDSNNLLQHDGNYGNTDVGIGDIVDFGEWAFVNATKNAVTYLKQRITSLHPHRTDPAFAVNYYTQYLSAK